MIVVFGKGLGPATLVPAAGFPLPTQIPDGTGTTISISAGSFSTKAFLLYTSDTQVAGIMPSAVAVGSATVSVSYNGQTSKGMNVAIVPASFGIFTKNSAGTGPAIAQNVSNETGISLNGLANAAKDGQALILYGTGLGGVQGLDSVPPGPVTVGSNVSVEIGGTELKPMYAGRSPQYPGLDQINIQLPSDFSAASGAGALGGCYMPILVRVGNAISNTATVSLASGKSTCNHPLHLAPDVLARLDAGGNAYIGLLQIANEVTWGPTRTSSLIAGAAGVFAEATPNDVFLAALQITGGAHTSPGPNSSDFLVGQLSYPVSAGTCVTYRLMQSVIPDYTNAKFGFGRVLNAGTALALSGPGIQNEMTPDPYQQNAYTNQSHFPTPFTNGDWTITGTGGGEVGPFAASIVLPGLVSWTNASQYYSTRSQNVTRGPLPITWVGGAADQIVIISGTSTISDPIVPENSRGAGFSCAVPATAGAFTVPADIVQTLPAVPSGVISYFGTLGLKTYGSSAFSAPLIAGGAIDAGVFSWAVVDTRPVIWQ